MDLFFLGTGAGMPAKLRNVSSVVLQLLEERRAVWMFDCGEATQHQILKTSVKPRKIEKIFITHLHGDHIYGLPGLLGSRSFQGGTEPLTIYGPKGIREYVETSLRISRTYLKYSLEIIEFEEGVIFEDEGFQVETRLLDHAVPSYGFRIIEKDKPGELLVDRLMEENIPRGPVYSRLKKGETVQLEDGRTIKGADFTGPPKPGMKLAILGDTRPCANALILGNGTDCLVHEATFRQGQEDMANEFFHSTNVQAAECARQAGAKKLILTHISSRFMPDDTVDLVNEARAIFPNTEMAEDLMKIDI